MENTQWHHVDMRGYLDNGPSCDGCEACNCADTLEEPLNQDWHDGCIGLAVYHVDMDDGQAYCDDCYEETERLSNDSLQV